MNNEELKQYDEIKKQFQQEKKIYKKRAILSLLPLPVLLLLIKELFIAVQTPIELEGILITQQILVALAFLTVSLKTVYEIYHYLAMAIEIKDLNIYVKEEMAKEKTKQKTPQKGVNNIKQRTSEEKIKILNETKEMLIQHLQEEIPKVKKITK